MSRASINSGYVNQIALENIARITSRIKKQITDLLNISLNDYVLDIGCGLGVETISIAQQVKDQGLVIGIDYDTHMLNIAQHCLTNAGLSENIKFIPANTNFLPFASNSFDACRCERVFQHLTNDDQAFQEIVRVTKPGGRIVIADSDWASLSIDTVDTKLERRIVQGIAELLNNGYAGRRLARLFIGNGLVDLAVEAHPIIWRDYKSFCATCLSMSNIDNSLVKANVATKADIKEFRKNLQFNDKQDVFFATGTIIMVSGKKP